MATASMRIRGALACALVLGCGPNTPDDGSVGGDGEEECPELIWTETGEGIRSLELQTADIPDLPLYTVIDGNLRIREIEGIKDLSFLSCVAEIRGALVVADNPELVSLVGLEGLTSVVSPWPEYDHIAIRDNPKLRSLEGLSAVEDVGNLSIEDNPVLESLEGLSRFRQAEVISITGNDSLETIGLRELESVEELTIGATQCPPWDPETEPAPSPVPTGNPSLSEIDGLDSLTEYVQLRISGNASLASLTTLGEHLGGASGQLVDIELNELLPSEEVEIRLARVEDQSFVNNATGIWRSLFLVWLSQTHQPWAARFERLVQRCTRGSVEDRLLALEGLATSVAANEQGLGHEPGRDWPRPSLEAGVAHKREARTLLLQMCSCEQAAIADRARVIVAAQLRGWVMAGEVVDSSLVDRLCADVASWTAAQRQSLAETLADIRRYDNTSLPAELDAALALLEARLKPHEFVERLIAQVGSWQPGPWQVDDPEREAHEEERDAELAREALSTPQRLIQQWSWMSSSAAQRRRPFMRTLGRLDLERVFLPSLEQFTMQAPTPAARVLAWYVEGWSLAPDGDAVDPWIAAQLEGATASAATMALPHLRPSDARLRLLIERVERGPVGELSELRPLSRRWVERTSPALMLRLLDAIGEQAGLALLGISLIQELLRQDFEGEIEGEIVARALSLLVLSTQLQMPIVREHDWERVALALAERGKIDAVVSAVLDMLTTSGPSNPVLATRMLTKLLERGHAATIWDQVGVRLEREQDSWALIWELARVRLLSKLEPEQVLAWVGTNQARATLVAQLVNPHGPRLNQVARELLERFGAHSPFAPGAAVVDSALAVCPIQLRPRS